jgi:hypothetical protein
MTNDEWRVTNDGIARAAQALPQRQRLRGVCAACRFVIFMIFFYKGNLNEIRQ